MKQESKIRLYNQAYSFGISCPKPFQEAIIVKMQSFAQGKYPEKWKYMQEAFELGNKDRAFLARQLQLERVKKRNENNLERGR